MKKIRLTKQEWKMFVKGLILFSVLLTPFLFTKTRLDTDTYFILNIGRYTLDNGFTFTDPFTMHTGLEYVFQQWLTGVYFYVLYNVFGETGLILFIMLEGVVLLFLFYWLCMFLSGGRFYVSAFLTFVFSLAASSYMTTRPQITTYIIMVLLIYALEKYVRTGKYRYLCIIPLLSVLEINLHAATWVLLFVFALPYVCSPDILSKKTGFDGILYRKMPVLVSLFVSGLCGFINPYGYKAVIYLFMSGGAENKLRISELQPLTFTAFYGVLVLILFCTVLITASASGKIPIRFLLLCGGTFIMGILAFRNIVFSAAGSCIYLAYASRNGSCYEMKGVTVIYLKFIICLLAVFVCCECVMSALLLTGRTERQETKDCHEIVRWLDEHGATGSNLCTDFNYGAYFEFYGYRSSMDARMELYTKQMNKKHDYYDEYSDFCTGKIYYDDYISAYDFDYIVINNSLLSGLFEHDEKYEKLVDTDTYDLWRRKEVTAYE